MTVQLMELSLGEVKSGITLRDISHVDRIDSFVCLIIDGRECRYRKGETFFLSDVSYSIARIQDELVTLSYYSVTQERDAVEIAGMNLADD